VLGGAPAQQPAGAPVELAWDARRGGGRDELAGEVACCSTSSRAGPDLLDWRYFNFLAQGDPAGHRFPFACPAARYFRAPAHDTSSRPGRRRPGRRRLSTGFELAHSMATA
jgi:hypothetical protein